MVEENKFVHFKDRGEKWKDVEPIEQYEGGAAPIAAIQYSPQCKSLFLNISAVEEVMGYFRALFHKNEISQRAFDLTTEVIYLNPGNYSAWHYRRVLLDELKLPLEDEMKFLNHIQVDLEKNYQIWHHRRCIMEIYKKDFDQEKELLADVFDSDAKNYHAWSYRVWLVERFKLWTGELDYIESLLDEDVQNNSAWSYRYFLIMKTSEKFETELVRNEIKYVISKRLPQNLLNESPWVYLRGMLATNQDEAEKSLKSNAKKEFILQFPELKEFCLDLIKKDEQNKGNRFIYMTLIDFCVAETDFEKAIEYLSLLKMIDKIRVNYWQWRINEIESILKIEK